LKNTAYTPSPAASKVHVAMRAARNDAMLAVPESTRPAGTRERSVWSTGSVVRAAHETAIAHFSFWVGLVSLEIAVRVPMTTGLVVARVRARIIGQGSS